MSIRVPIFQMIVTERPYGSSALVFSSELPYSCSQDIAFCLPLYNTIPGSGTKELIYLSNEQIIPIMPVAKEKETINLEGRFTPPFVSFDLEQIGVSEKIRFTLAFKSGGWITPDPINKTPLTLRYKGNWKVLSSMSPYFLLLIPDNIEQFNYLYKEFKLAVVGFTPHFGHYERNKHFFEAYE